MTVRGRRPPAALGALAHEAMGAEWLGKKALAHRRAAELPDYGIE